MSEVVACTLAVVVQTSAMFDKTPYFRIEMIVIDTLHAVDLGVSQDVLGNVFYQAMENLYDGGNRLATGGVD